MNKKIITCAALAALLAMTLGVTFASGSHRVAATPIVYGVPTSNPTPSPRAGPPSSVLADAVSRIGNGAIASASLGAPPAGVQTSRQSLPWLHAIVHVPALANGAEIRALWVADLVEGVVAESEGTSSNMHDSFGGSTFDGQLPNGTLLADIGGGMGDIVRGQSFLKQDQNDSSTVSGLGTTLRSDGLTPVSVGVLRPIGGAPYVIASTNSPADTLAQTGKILSDLFGGSTPYFEGYYFELRDAAGDPLLRTSAAFRTGAGRLWINPAYSGDVVGVTSF